MRARTVFLISLLFLSFHAHAAFDSGTSIDQFFSQVLAFVATFGGIPWTLKVAGIISLVISLTKVSFFRPIWDLAGPAKAIIAPVLGLIYGILSLDPQYLTLAGIVAYVFAGAGAIIVHEILDGIKAIPGVGPHYVAIIDVISKIFRAPNAK